MEISEEEKKAINDLMNYPQYGEEKQDWDENQIWEQVKNFQLPSIQKDRKKLQIQINDFSTSQNKSPSQAQSAKSPKSALYQFRTFDKQKNKPELIPLIQNKIRSLNQTSRRSRSIDWNNRAQGKKQETKQKKQIIPHLVTSEGINDEEYKVYRKNQIKKNSFGQHVNSQANILKFKKNIQQDIIRKTPNKTKPDYIDDKIALYDLYKSNQHKFVPNIYNQTQRQLSKRNFFQETILRKKLSEEMRNFTNQFKINIHKLESINSKQKFITPKLKIKIQHVNNKRTL